MRAGGRASLTRSHGSWRLRWGEVVAGVKACEHTKTVSCGKRGAEEGVVVRGAEMLLPSSISASLCCVSHPLLALPFASPHSHRDMWGLASRWGRGVDRHRTLWKRGWLRLWILGTAPFLFSRQLEWSISVHRGTQEFFRNHQMQKLFFQMYTGSNPVSWWHLLDL